MGNKFELSKEDRWITALVGMLVVLISIFVVLQRKPLCVDSKFVDVLEILHEQGVSRVYRCQTKREPLGIEKVDFRELSLALEKLNRSLAVVEPLLREHLFPIDRSPGIYRLSLEDRQLNNFWRVGLWLSKANGGPYQALVEAALDLSFGAEENLQNRQWPFELNVQKLFRASVLETLSHSPATSEWKLKWYSSNRIVQELAKLIEVEENAAPGLMTLIDPTVQSALQAKRVLEQAMDRLVRKYSLMAETEEGRFVGKLHQGLQARGLFAQKIQLEVDHLIFSEGLTDKERGQLLQMIQQGQYSAALYDQKTKQIVSKQGLVSKSLLTRLKATETLKVHCGKPDQKLLSAFSRQSRRLLLVHRCAALQPTNQPTIQPTIQWTGLFREGVLGFAASNPELPFVQLNSLQAQSFESIAEEQLKADSLYNEKEDFYRAGSKQEVILAYRSSKKPSVQSKSETE